MLKAHSSYQLNYDTVLFVLLDCSGALIINAHPAVVHAVKIQKANTPPAPKKLTLHVWNQRDTDNLRWCSPARWIFVSRYPWSSYCQGREFQKSVLRENSVTLLMFPVRLSLRRNTDFLVISPSACNPLTPYPPGEMFQNKYIAVYYKEQVTQTSINSCLGANKNITNNTSDPCLMLQVY